MSSEHVKVFNGPILVAELDVDYEHETVSNYHLYTDNWFVAPFGFGEVSYGTFLGFLESRCPSPNRYDIKKILEMWRIFRYDPVSICKHTRGLLFDDFLWIKFEGDDVTYDDIKIRTDFPDSL